MTHLTLAERLLQKLGVTTAAEIDVEAIAFTEGATVRQRRLEGCEARIVGTEDRAVITVNSASGPRRRRFSMGHELGHWTYHRGKTFICRAQDIGGIGDYDPHDPERVADRFAADLLMPAYLFAPRASQLGKMTLDTADALKEEFDMSLTSAAIRLVEIGPEPAMVICHRQGRRAWFRRHPSVPETLFPRHDLHPDSYASDVLAGKTERSRPATIGADAWIDHWKAGRFEVTEQTSRVGSDAILTMVWWRNEAQLDDEERFQQQKSADYRRRPHDREDRW